MLDGGLDLPLCHRFRVNGVIGALSLLGATEKDDRHSDLYAKFAYRSCHHVDVQPS